MGSQIQYLLAGVSISGGKKVVDVFLHVVAWLSGGEYKQYYLIVRPYISPGRFGGVYQHLMVTLETNEDVRAIDPEVNGGKLKIMLVSNRMFLDGGNRLNVFLASVS